MNQPTRERFGAALARLSDGVAALEALAGDEEADLLGSERQALQKALPPLHEAIGPISAIAFNGQDRPPQRGKVTAPAPEPAAATPAAPVAPVAPVADRGVAAGLKAMALAIKELSYAVRGHSETVLEVRQAPPPARAAAPRRSAPAGAAKPRNRRSGPPPGLRSGAVAEALGVPVSALQLQVKKQGGPQVGLTVGNWHLVAVTHGPGGRARLWWGEVQQAT